MNFLEEIIKEKKSFLEQRKRNFPKNLLIDKLSFPLCEPQFKRRLKEDGAHLIAEIKRASPSKGELRPGCDALNVAKIYEFCGVRLASVLTEERFFKGNIEDVQKIKSCTTLAVLRKDFIIDDYQLLESKAFGADAILLIVSILDQDKLAQSLKLAKSLFLDAVVEVRTDAELKTALDCQAEIIGINNRNLSDFSVDLKAADILLPQVPKDKVVIVESGIHSAEQIRRAKGIGAKGVLVGEALMLSEDIEQKTREFLEALK